MWELKDYRTNMQNAGYFRIMLNGTRVADVFPYAAGADAEWTIKQAETIVATMNRHQTSLTEG